jgi:VanZ family protein
MPLRKETIVATGRLQNMTCPETFANPPIAADACTLRPSRHAGVRWLAIGYTLALTYLLLAPHPLFFLGQSGAAADEAVSETVADCAQHAAVFALLTGLWVDAVGDRWGRGAVVGTCVAYGAATECLQAFIPHREFGWIDLIANSVGAAGGMLVAVVVYRWKSRDL